MKTISKIASVVLVLALYTLMYGQTQAQPPAQQQPAQPAAPGQTQPAAPPSQSGQPAQPGQTTQPAQPGQPAQAAQPQQKKEIKDPAEYNAYISGAGQTDPAAKASAMESFLTQYPNTVVKEEALEALMAAYQQLNNANKMGEAANRLLQANPSNIKGLLVMALQARAAAETGNPQAAQQARQYGERGLQAIESYQRPEGMTDADFQKLRSTSIIIFNGAAGRGALQNKDFAAAQKYFGVSVQADPNNLNDLFALTFAFLEPKPPMQEGFWQAARAAGLAQRMAQGGQLPAASAKQIFDYGRIKYKNFHGGEDGWQELIAQAQSSPTPPQGFAVKPAPTPVEQCAALAASKDPKKMDFGEWQLVFTYCDQPTQDRVWQAIQGVKLQFLGQVMQAAPTTLQLAATADAIQAKTADVEVTMAAPLTKARIPKVGQQITLEAVPTSYDKQPYKLHMEQGKLAVARKAAPAPRRRR